MNSGFLWIFRIFSKHLCYRTPLDDYVCIIIIKRNRNSLPVVFCKKDVFKNFAKTQENTCEFCEIFKTPFHGTAPALAFEDICWYLNFLFWTKRNCECLNKRGNLKKACRISCFSGNKQAKLNTHSSYRYRVIRT